MKIPKIIATIPEEVLLKGNDGYKAFAIAKATYITIADIAKTLKAPTISSIALSDQCLCIKKQNILTI